MLHARTANIRCDRYYSNFLNFGVQLNKASSATCEADYEALNQTVLYSWVISSSRNGATCLQTCDVIHLENHRACLEDTLERHIIWSRTKKR